MKIFFVFLGFILSSLLLQAQSKRDSAKKDSIVVEQIQSLHEGHFVKFNSKKAALYSAICPGLGQYYNKKYWKIPIAVGAVGTGVGVALWNQNQYLRYRKAYIASLNGQTHEFSSISGVTTTVLANAQDQMKRQRDYSIAITAAIYLLNIIDAMVDAHLYEVKHDPDLAFSPVVIPQVEQTQASAKFGVGVRYRF